MNTLMTCLVASAAMLTALATATAALANPPAPHQSTAVEYRDLDLTTETGRTALERRVVHAVRSVCTPTNAGQLKAEGDVRRCMRAARSSVESNMQRAIALAATNRNTGG